MNGGHLEGVDGVEMTASQAPATMGERDDPDTPEDHETVPVTIGYGALENNGKFVFSWQRLFMFAGPGLLMSIAYIDPGNLESDLQTGFRAGYRLGWIVLWSTVLGFIVQLLAMRLGIVTGKHLAEHCRNVYPMFPRIVLWLMTEVAIIGSDIQEVIGSAIAIQLLSNGALPLWVGVLVTGVDTFFLLYLERFGVRKLEAFFATLVAIMTVSFGVMYFKAECPTDEVIIGTVVPRIRWAHMDIAVGIVGALVMPHNIFLHSALVQSRKIDVSAAGAKHEAIVYNAIESAASLAVTVVINLSLMSVFASGFYGESSIPEVGLSTAGRHLGDRFGPAMKYIWAIGLFAAGQSSTMTGTYTGQFVMSGFMEMHVSAWLRACITRSVALVPTLAVAIAYAGTNEMDTLNQGLNVLQSVQLPFALIPVLYMSTRADVMGPEFVLKRTFRTCVQLICGLLLVLNLSLVAYYLVGGLVANAWLGLLTLSFCACYAGFVIYLLFGPGNTYDWLAKHDSPVSRLACRWFGRERGVHGAAVLQQDLFVVSDEDAFAIGEDEEVHSPLPVEEA
eukprot:jgi/Ulvmu1/1691/UM116_0002.1